MLASQDDFRDQLERFLSEASTDLSDEYGTGDAKLYAIAEDSGTALQSFWAMATAMIDNGTGTERQVEALRFAFEDGSWRLTADSIPKDRLMSFSQRSVLNWELVRLGNAGRRSELESRASQ